MSWSFPDRGESRKKKTTQKDMGQEATANNHFVVG